MTIFTPIFNTIDVSKYRCFLFDVSYPSMVATDVNTDIEHRCLCSMSHPYTRSIRTVSREMGLSKSSVQRVLADNRRHPYHYTRVQHLLPEDYPIRREFCLWLRNQNDAPHFLSGILFSDELLFCR
jgi:hypothetical protein